MNGTSNLFLSVETVIISGQWSVFSNQLIRFQVQVKFQVVSYFTEHYFLNSEHYKELVY
jgi:hypothetical protein